MMRKLVIGGAAVLVLVAAVLGKNLLAASKKEVKKVKEQTTPTVFVEKVFPKIMSLPIEENGLVRSSKEIVLSVEVQGVLEMGAKPFKTGYAFKKGEVIVAVNNKEFLANLKSQRSSFINLTASLMPDIQLDYPEVYEKWKTFLSSLDVNNRFSKLPSFDSDNESLFLSGKGLTSAYYQLQSLEEKMTKFKVIAPFDGVLTQNNTEEGALVRPGQQLGVFIDNHNLEVEVAVNANYINKIAVGDVVELQINNVDEKIEAKVQRINATVDSSTQTGKMYIQLKNKQLSSGLIVKVKVYSKSHNKLIKIPLSLLIGNKYLYSVEGDRLKKNEVLPEHFYGSDVYVSGLKRGTLILKKPLPQAVSNMKVLIAKED